MNKLVQNIHWAIILWSLYNAYSVFSENSERPAEAKIKTETARQSLAKNKKIKKDLDLFYKNIEEAKVKIQKVKESIEKTEQLLPTSISDNENMSLLRDTGDGLNIKRIEITPGQEEERGLLVAKQYTLKANATYVQFLVFFEKISGNKRMLNIRNVSLQRTQEEQRTRFPLLEGSFVLEAYRFNLKNKPETPQNLSPTKQSKTSDKKV